MSSNIRFITDWATYTPNPYTHKWGDTPHHCEGCDDCTYHDCRKRRDKKLIQNLTNINAQSRTLSYKPGITIEGHHYTCELQITENEGRAWIVHESPRLDFSSYHSTVRIWTSETEWYVPDPYGELPNRFQQRKGCYTSELGESFMRHDMKVLSLISQIERSRKHEFCCYCIRRFNFGQSDDDHYRFTCKCTLPRLTPTINENIITVDCYTKYRYSIEPTVEEGMVWSLRKIDVPEE